MPLKLSLLIGAVFGVIAAIMAFLIIYNEYSKHRLSRPRLWKEALGGSTVAFFVILSLSMAAGWFLSLPLRDAHYQGTPASRRQNMATLEQGDLLLLTVSVAMAT